MADEATEKNVLGQHIKDGQVVEPTPPAAADAPKPEDKGADDIEKNPLVIELRKQIEDIKKEYGNNFKGARDKIDRLEKQIADAKKDQKAPEFKPPFPNVVFSKDLPKDQRDNMSEGERELHDQLMTTHQTINEQARAKFDADSAAASDAAKKATEGTQFDVVKAVQDESMKLADGNYNKAQELIGKFNTLGFDLSQITADNVAERIAAVADLIPDFKPKNEQETKPGAPVKTTGASTGVDSVVAAAAAEREGNANGDYQL